MQIKSIFSFLWRWTLLLKVIRYHLGGPEVFKVAACHTTTIYVQNGTWLNTSRWLQNGFFGSEDSLPLTGRPFNLSATSQATTVNPVLPLLPYIPNRHQGCICGELVKLRKIIWLFRGYVKVACNSRIERLLFFKQCWWQCRAWLFVSLGQQGFDAGKLMKTVLPSSLEAINASLQ